MNKVVVDEEKRDIGVGASRKVSNSELFIRFMALLLSLAAALVLAFDKQTEIIPVTLVSTLPPLYVPATAKFHYLSAFTYVLSYFTYMYLFFENFSKLPLFLKNFLRFYYLFKIFAKILMFWSQKYDPQPDATSFN